MCLHQTNLCPVYPASSPPLSHHTQVGDMSLVTLKEARAMLYKLMAAKITQLQEVPRKPDHNPMVTFYLWSVVRQAMSPTPSGGHRWPLGSMWKKALLTS